MSQELHAGRGRTLVIAGWVTGAVLSLLLLLVLTLLAVRTPPAEFGAGRETASSENPLAAARATLAKQDDLASCRDALQQLNNHLAGDPLPAPREDELHRLRQEFGLADDEVEEVKKTTFTPLDAYHLEACFLFRDAARSLSEQGAPSARAGPTPRQTPLEQAAAAFAWVVRQVRLDERPVEPVPPAFVLRRGWGTALERALVFLAVLEQFGQEDEAASGLQGCLLQLPGKQPRLWACGVALGDRPDALYLFDPRLGLPLPGPGGQGIATLARSRTVPGELRAGGRSYDVTAEQARDAEVLLVCSLSALAPRQKVLQDKLLRDRQWKGKALPAPVRVRLSQDLPRALARLRGASAGPDGKKAKVSIWRPATGLLRRFLPRDEGGSDALPDPGRPAPTRRQAFQGDLVPWEEFPAQFRDPRYFSRETELGRRVYLGFAVPFLRAVTEPGTPRDLILRGHFSKAAPELVKEREQWRLLKEQARNANDLDKEVREWADRAIAVHADFERAKAAKDPLIIAKAKQEVEQVWKEAAPLEILRNAALATPRGADATYLLGLCKHEEAERQQARLDRMVARAVAALAPPTPGVGPVGALAPWAGADSGKLRTAWAADAAKVRAAWTDAQGWWREYCDDYRGRPEVPAARRMRGRAEAMLGDRAAAVRTWQDLSGPMTELEKLANLYQAQQLEGR